MAFSYKRSLQRLEPERLVADVMREQRALERARLQQRLFVARLQLANVLVIGKGIAMGAAPTGDIFGLDELRSDRGSDPLFGDTP
jgi:hypothetical protein